MHKLIAGLLGALGALVLTAPAHAAPVSVPQAVMAAPTYAAVVHPVATTLAVVTTAEPEATVQQVQYRRGYYGYRGRHHRYFARHHRRYYRR